MENFPVSLCNRFRIDSRHRDIRLEAGLITAGSNRFSPSLNVCRFRFPYPRHPRRMYFSRAVRRGIVPAFLRLLRFHFVLGIDRSNREYPGDFIKIPYSWESTDGQPEQTHTIGANREHHLCRRFICTPHTATFLRIIF